MAIWANQEGLDSPSRSKLAVTMEAYASRRSRTEFVVFLNRTPTYWFSKKEASCKVSACGSEFTAMTQTVKYACGLLYKLRMMRIACEKSIYVYGDNMSVMSNTTAPVSTLKKKMNSLLCHFISKGCACDNWLTMYVNTRLNCDNLLKKCFPAWLKPSGFIRKFLHCMQRQVGREETEYGLVPDIIPKEKACGVEYDT